MDNKDIVSTLNDLIETSRDGDEGFRTSAEHAKDVQLKSLLARQEGLQSVLYKPFRADRLLESVEQALRPATAEDRSGAAPGLPKTS